MGGLGSCGDTDSLRWQWWWSESDLDVVVNTLKQQFSRECDYFAFLGGSQSPNQCFKDVSTSIIIEQDSKCHLSPTNKPKSSRSYQSYIHMTLDLVEKRSIQIPDLRRKRERDLVRAIWLDRTKTMDLFFKFLNLFFYVHCSCLLPFGISKCVRNGLEKRPFPIFPTVSDKSAEDSSMDHFFYVWW